MFKDYELDTLRYYTKGNVIREEDREILYGLSAIGMVRLGLTTSGDEPKETAKLTELGWREVGYYGRLRLCEAARGHDNQELAGSAPIGR